MKCGCKIKRGERPVGPKLEYMFYIEYCPMHKAAPAMITLLTKIKGGLWGNSEWDDTIEDEIEQFETLQKAKA